MNWIKEINKGYELKHYSYPSIEQYKTVIYNVNHTTEYIGKDENDEPIYDRLKTKPTLSFVGTVKLHGTNAAIVIDLENEIVYYQSRERIITPFSDNAGFAMSMSNIQEKIYELAWDWLSMNGNINVFPENTEPVDIYQIIIYGEWCGGNIQKGIGLNKLNKMFVIFDVKLIINNDVYWVNHEAINDLELKEEKIYSIYNFPTYTIDIDFNYPELSQNKLIELTQQVEDSCPVTASFGIENECGEGIVWKCTTQPYTDPKYWMKVKGTKHSSSKVKTIASVNVEEITGIREFVENVVTDNRCIQSLSKLKENNQELSRKNLGPFISWICADVIKEESDSIITNQFNPKTIGSHVANKAREWFFKNELNFNNLV